MSCMAMSGEKRSLPRFDRAHAPTPAQKLRHRNAQWLFLAEVGLIDPAVGRVRPQTTRQIADLCNCSVRIVQQGIQSARQIRELIGD